MNAANTHGETKAIRAPKRASHVMRESEAKELCELLTLIARPSSTGKTADGVTKPAQC